MGRRKYSAHHRQGGCRSGQEEEMASYTGTRRQVGASRGHAITFAELTSGSPTPLPQGRGREFESRSGTERIADLSEEMGLRANS